MAPTVNPIRIASAVGRAIKGNAGVPRYYLGDTSERRDDFDRPGDTVLLIQGFFQTRRVMVTIERRLRADGFRVLSFHLGGLLGNFNTRSVPELARMIDRKVRRLRERGELGRMHLVGHSKGGVIARYMVQVTGADEYVSTVITLGSPHHGTPTAALGAGLGLLFVSRSLWQMFPGSPLVREMNNRRFPAHVRLVSIYSKSDLICPWTYSALTPRDGEDVRNVLVNQLGHMDLVEDPYVYGLMLRELAGRPADSAGGPLAEVPDDPSLRLGRA